jgi:chromosome segregation ATPase
MKRGENKMTEEEIQTLQAELESIKGEVEGLTAEKETLASELETKGASITELEQVIVTKDGDIVTLKQAASESDVIASEAKQSLANAVVAYKAVVVQANPYITEELITGNTIDELNQSVEKAKTLIAQVRTSIEAEIASGKVPAGAPARTPPDLSALSPREKIQYAIKGSP